ncbi:hypothetical protein ES703_112088 [subsurface metagenome]
MTRLEDLLEKQRRLEESKVPTPAVELTLVEQVQANSHKIETLRAETQAIRISTEEEERRLAYDVYRPKIRQLEDERSQATQEVREKYEQARDQKQKEIEGLEVVINQVSRIIDFLRLETAKDLAIDDDDVKPYRDRAKENLGYLFDDDYLKIKLFIVGNGKPKNKFSLIAMGRCLFGEHLLKLRYEYGADVHTGHGYNIVVVIRDMPSVAELQPWLEDSRRQQLIIGLTGGYEKVKAEYLDVIGKYTPEDFKELMTDHCGCGYFYTIFDNIRRSDEPALCPRCGKAMEEVGGV